LSGGVVDEFESLRHDLKAKLIGLRMLTAKNLRKRRSSDAGIKAAIGCSTFRAAGITNSRTAGASRPQRRMAWRSNAKTTGLHDRRNDYVSVGEVEWIWTWVALELRRVYGKALAARQKKGREVPVNVCQIWSLLSGPTGEQIQIIHA
jgi:hypothetical protein